MKKSEVYIEKISKEFRISPATAKEIYGAINKYDYACFCSYMGDYDQPQERTEAKKVLNRFKGHYSPNFQKIINQIQEYMNNDEEYDIHEMGHEIGEN
jgi:hypothetical protein